MDNEFLKEIDELVKKTENLLEKAQKENEETEELLGATMKQHKERFEGCEFSIKALKENGKQGQQVIVTGHKLNLGYMLSRAMRDSEDITAIVELAYNFNKAMGKKYGK